MATVFTRSLQVKKEQSFFYDASDSKNKGNGGDRHIPLGRTNNDSKYRAALKFSLDWTDVYQVVSAVLVVKSSQETHVGFGTGPTIEVQRASEAWIEGGGSEGAWVVPGNAAAAYPGPSTTTATYTGGPYGSATGAYRRIDITGIVNLWAPDTVLRSTGEPGGGATNEGIRLQAPDESTTADRYELFGSRAPYAGQRPYIELGYISNKPPNAPIITSPEVADPAIVDSDRANVLSIDFLFNDPDPADTCARVNFEVYGDGAMDGAPGSLVAGHQPSYPSGVVPLGPLNAYRVGISAGLTPRTNYRYRIATMDSELTWGPFTSLADGRVFMAYTVGAPAQPYMDPTTDAPRIYGSIVSNDPDDYVTGVEVEVYRDTTAGSVTLWAPGSVGIGGTSTRSDVAYAGASLKDGDVVRWRLRHANRDGVWGTWASWQYTTVHAALGPDAMSPVSPSTKLLTRTPTLTIGHSSAFDGYRWRLYRDGVVIHDSGETATTSTSSVGVTVPSGLLTWGDGSDAEVPLEWDAQIRIASSGTYGEWSPMLGLRINALPGASLSLVTTRTAVGTIATPRPDLLALYQNVDQQAFNEWPAARVVEYREATTTGGDLPAHDGALIASVGVLHASTPLTEAIATGFDLATDTDVEVRMRWRDDATAKVSTTLATSASVGATNIKVASVSGMTAGDTIEFGSASVGS